jgi:hypothetical protein
MDTKEQWNFTKTSFTSSVVNQDKKEVCSMSLGDSMENKKAGLLISAAPDMLDALKSVNNYFIELQRSYKLTEKDERLWAKVSKAINKTEE